MESAIYEGWVRHRRFTPVENAFTYSAFMLYLDLDELPMLFKHCAWCSHERFNFASFHRKDYLGPANLSLKEAVTALVHERTGAALAGPIRLLTNLRYFNYSFNPVSFYYCYDPAGTTIETIVAEITNTPWGERHCYVLPRGSNSASRNFRFQFHKQFHISPFIGMDADYDWRFTAPTQRLLIHMENTDGTKTERPYFDSTLLLQRREFSSRRMAWMLARHPVMSLRVVAGIYYQAFKLWAKRCPVHPHPKSRDVSLHELKPRHPSLTSEPRHP